MKRSILPAILCAISLYVSSQQMGQLVSAHSNAGNNIFSSVDLSSGVYHQISTLGGPFNPVTGETTFDETNCRYFVKSGSNILIINAITGVKMDSIPNTGSFHNIEYDGAGNSIVGMVKTGTVVTFKAYNITTKTGTIKSTLNPVDSLMAGESTFDPASRKYFSMTNLGMIVVDSNGILINVLCSSPHLNGIEYDPVVNKIFYLEWNGACYNLVSIDANSCSIAVLGSISTITVVAKGESAFDRTSGRYFSRTNLGLTQIDKQTGSVIQALPNTNSLIGIEFRNLNILNVANNNFREQVSVFPNPGNDRFNFSGAKPGSSLDVMDATGRSVFKTILTETTFMLDLEGEEKGIYFYRISGQASCVQGKLLLK